MRPLTLEDITTNDPDRQCENVALYRQVCSGNPPNLDVLRCTSIAFPNRVDGGFNYSDFPDDKWDKGTRSADLTSFKKFAWIYLKPDILEHLLLQIYNQGKSCRKRMEEYTNLAAWFIFEIAEPLELKDIGKVDYYELARLYPRILLTPHNTNNKQNYDKNQLQRKEVALSRGEGLTGAVIHGRQHKATVTVGHLSYQVCPE